MAAALIVLTVVFNILSGVLDSSNIVAMPISSRAMPPRLALLVAALCAFVSPYVFGVAVARTIGQGLFGADVVPAEVIVAGLASAIVWTLVTWRVGLPSSSSHALIGGLVGATAISEGWAAVHQTTLIHVLLALLISPPLGLAIGFGIMSLVLLIVQDARPSVNAFFKRTQILAVCALALSYGANDGQKALGVLATGLVDAGVLGSFGMPAWVIAISSGAVSLGMFVGGWRLIRTLGGRIYRIRPVHAFSSQISGTAVVLSAALIGAPVSTTQVMSSSIAGVGAADRINMIRWGLVRDMALAWVLTLPVTALLAGLLSLLFSRIW